MKNYENLDSAGEREAVKLVQAQTRIDLRRMLRKSLEGPKNLFIDRMIDDLGLWLYGDLGGR